MQSWWPDIAGRSGPIYRAIADAIEQAVRTGALRPGERLPPQRELAAALAIDLTTVTRAYAIARDAGLIEGAGRLGSYVRNGAELAIETLADSGMIMPPQPGFALLAEAMRGGMAKLLRAGGQSPLLQYQPSGGGLHDRKAAAEAFAARGLPTDETEVVITAGGQNALHAIFATIFAPGDRLCVARSAYPGALALAARFGLEIVPIAADAGGIDPAGFEAAARDGLRALYVVPTNDNPTSATLDIARRRAIAASARRHGVTIVEDDAYGRLPAAPLPPIATMAPELSWHIASVAKIISPVLRVAHVRAPSAGDAARLAADLHETAVMAPPLNAALVGLWMRDGSFDDLVGAVRAEAIARQRIARAHIGGLGYAAHPEGYHLWLPLPAHVDPRRLAAAVRPAGLSIVPGDAFAADRAKAEHAVRISLGGAIDHARLARAFERVGALVGAP